MNTLAKFSLKNKVAIITGGGGILGQKHAEAIAEVGGIPVLWDVNLSTAAKVAAQIKDKFSIPALAVVVDITQPDSVAAGLVQVLSACKRVDILINNAASDPKVEAGQGHLMRVENLSLKIWQNDIAVGLTGSFLCSQVVGTHLAKNGGGVILNIASDLAVVAPDQRLYRKEGLAEDMQPVKAITYSVVKHGILGLTKYLSTYWAASNVRVNSLSPGGVYNEKVPDDFVAKLTQLIPLGRMANVDDYKAAVVFLCSDASAYMTGHNLIMDGGRTVL